MNGTLLSAQGVDLTSALGNDNASINITATQNVPQAQLTQQLAQVQMQIAQQTKILANLNAQASALQSYLVLIPVPAQPVIPPAS